MEVAAILQIVALVVEHGAPAVTAGIKAMDKENVTLEDVQKLGDTMKDPEEYFK